MPLIEGEGTDWDETEKELDSALCNFCNDVADPIDNIELWNESIKHKFKELCKAYNNWYDWRSDKSERAENESTGQVGSTS
jgi:hypothetical protein